MGRQVVQYRTGFVSLLVAVVYGLLVRVEPVTQGSGTQGLTMQSAAPSPSTNDDQGISFTAYLPVISQQSAIIGQGVYAPQTATQLPLSGRAGAGQEAIAYYTIPITFPKITVTVPANGVDAGYLFLSNFQFSDCTPHPYLMMLDNQGEPVFYRALPPCPSAVDFKRQPNGLLTYWSSAVNAFQVMDSTYRVVDSYQAGNGYATDLHELQLLPNRHALLMSYDQQVIDNTPGIIPNGRLTATVTGLIIQELDADKQVVFEWRSWDHFQLTDTQDVYLQSEPVDYVHGNAIELDFDGNLLLSSRHLNEITKINRPTGEIIWRMGGKRNEFTFVNDPRGFSHQHDVRRLDNGNMTLYDNGNFVEPAYSRVVEYKVDEVNKIATLVREYRNTPDTFGYALGSTQRLPTQNTLVGWGASSNPTLTEFRPDGTKAFELALPEGEYSYRVFRFPWEGHPPWPPTLVVITQPVPTLYYSWNGATDIAGYRIYGGATLPPDVLIEATFKTSFETKTVLPPAALTQFCYYRVMPINQAGQETHYSNPVFVDSPECRRLPTLRMRPKLPRPPLLQPSIAVE